MDEIKTPHIEIKSNGFITEVFIDGKKLNNVTRLSVEQDAGDFMNVVFELFSDNVSIDTRLIPDLPDIYKPFYVKKELQGSDS